MDILAALAPVGGRLRRQRALTTRRGRGFTMVEVIVYGVLISLLMVALYSMLVMFLRSSRVVQAEADLENAATSGILHMVADIADSNAATVVISSNPPGIIMASPRDAYDRFQRDASGKLLWQKWICYYVDTTRNRLMRVTSGLTATTTTPPAPTQTLAWFAALPGARAVADSLSALQFANTNPVSISATFTRSVFSQDDAQVTITDSVNPRN